MANSENIYEVESVKLVVEKSTITIYAEGVARTPGYTNPRLEPHIYIQDPPDGIYGFDFVADKPGGMVQQVLMPISAKYEWHSPEDAKGVAVHAAINSIVEKVEGSKNSL